MEPRLKQGKSPTVIILFDPLA